MDGGDFELSQVSPSPKKNKLGDSGQIQLTPISHGGFESDRSAFSEE